MLFRSGIGRPARGDKSHQRVVEFGPVANPDFELGRLALWASSVDGAPLAFFEKSSRAFADGISGKKPSEANAWRKAREKFGDRDDADWYPAEGEQELETVRVWEGQSPIARADEAGLQFGFDELAREFFGPLIAARRLSPR